MEVDDDAVMPPGTWAPSISRLHGSELDGTNWDVLIAGTGIQQSLLALALSRSGKKILHVDKNEWYGGAEAALSLQEAEKWVERVEDPQSLPSLYFSDAAIELLDSKSEGGAGPKLSFSRAYSLALAPQLIYTQSRLLDALVSSKAHKQLEFLAMGSWWVYSRHKISKEEPSSSKSKEQAEMQPDTQSSGSSKLLRIPTNREDVAFSDSSIDIRAKRVLMKILRFILDFEEQRDVWEPFGDRPFTELLSGHFKLPTSVHDLLTALTLTPFSPPKTTTSFALPRIARHLRSTGRLGPGFSSVIPRWGGISEVVQVACRSAAVGGATYVLNKDVVGGVDAVWEKRGEVGVPSSWTLDKVQTGLRGGDFLKANYVVGAEEDMITYQETTEYDQQQADAVPVALTRSISIVSSPLKSLFPAAEGAQPPAGAIVVFPSGSLETLGEAVQPDETPPVYLIIHSSDTGDCPTGQSVIYASTALSVAQGKPLLKLAVEELLRAVEESAQSTVLWSLQYEQHNQKKQRSPGLKNLSSEWTTPRLLKFPPPSLDLVFDDRVIDTIKWAWLKVMEPEGNPIEFLAFPEREGMHDGEED